MKKLYSLLCILLASIQPVLGVSQYELEHKPTQYKVAYTSPTEIVYVDISSIHSRQEDPTYNMIQARTISIYKEQHILSDYTIRYTYHNGTKKSDIYLMDWQICNAKFYQQNGVPIESPDNWRSLYTRGVHVSTKGSATAEIGQFILHTALELEKITYTATNPYVAPKPYKSINHPAPPPEQPLFGMHPPRPTDNPMDHVIPGDPPPPTLVPPHMSPAKLGVYGPVPPPPPRGPRPDWLLDKQNLPMPGPNQPMGQWGPEPDYHAPKPNF